MPSKRRTKTEPRPSVPTAAPVPDRRYREILSLSTIEVDPRTGDETLMFDACLRWHGLPKSGVSLVERELIAFQQRLRDEGDRLAGQSS